MNATLETWSGSKVTTDRWPAVLKGWQRHAKRLRRELTRKNRPPRMTKVKPIPFETLIVEPLLRYQQNNESPVDTLCRLVYERERALNIIARAVLRDVNTFPPEG